MAYSETLQVVIEGMNNTGAAFSQANRNLNNFGDKVKSMEPQFRNMAMMGGAAFAGIAGAGLTAANKIEESQQTIQSQLGVTGDEAEVLAQSARDIYNEGFGKSLNQTSEAIITVKQNMEGLADLTEDETQEMAENAIKLADVYDTNVGESVNAARVLVEEFGISHDEAFDLITTGFQNGLNASGDFLESVTEYAPQFDEGEASVKEFFSVLETGMEGGVLGTDKVGDLFKEFVVSIQEGSDRAKESLRLLDIDVTEFLNKVGSGQISEFEAFEKVIKRLKNADTQAEAASAGIGLMKGQFEDLTLSGVKAIDTQSKSFQNVENSTKKLDDQYDTLSGSISDLSNTLKLQLGGALKSNSGQLKNIIDRIDQFVEKNPGWTAAITNVTLVATALATGIGLLGLAVSKVIEGIDLFRSGLIKASQSMLGQFAFAVLATIGTMKLLNEVSGAQGESFVEKWKNFTNAITELFGAMIARIAEFIVNKLQKRINQGITILEKFANAGVSAANAITNAFNAIPDISIPEWVPGLGGKEFSGFDLNKFDKIKLDRVQLGEGLTEARKSLMRQAKSKVGFIGPTGENMKVTNTGAAGQVFGQKQIKKQNNILDSIDTNTESQNKSEKEKTGQQQVINNITINGDVSGREVIEKVKQGLMSDLGRETKVSLQ